MICFDQYFGSGTYIGKLSYTIPITFTQTKWGLIRDRQKSAIT
jgi:hypothetical protein